MERSHHHTAAGTPGDGGQPRTPAAIPTPAYAARAVRDDPSDDRPRRLTCAGLVTPPDARRRRPADAAILHPAPPPPGRNPGAGTPPRPGRGGAWRCEAVGPRDELARHPAWKHAVPLELEGRIVAPALANAHTHLDLTHVGPRPPEPGGFAGWIAMIRRQRLAEPRAIAASVRDGVAMLRAGGTLAVGDIAAGLCPEPALALHRAGVCGVSYLEFFGLGQRGPAAADAAADLARRSEVGGAVRLGVQPHAPYSVSIEGYRRAAALGLPLATHLAESVAERQLIRGERGPIASMLADLGLWDEAVASSFGRARSPVAHVADALADAKGPAMAVHCNDLDEEDIASLARAQVAVAYCPRASAYFRAEEDFGPHRYRELLGAGVPVALGTDSVVNLPAASVASRGLCVLEEARLLLDRDATPVPVLLEMLYEHTPAALGLDGGLFALTPGATVLGLIAVWPDRTPGGAGLGPGLGGESAGAGLIASSGPIEFL